MQGGKNFVLLMAALMLKYDAVNVCKIPIPAIKKAIIFSDDDIPEVKKTFCFVFSKLTVFSSFSCKSLRNDKCKSGGKTRVIGPVNIPPIIPIAKSNLGSISANVITNITVIVRIKHRCQHNSAKKGKRKKIFLLVRRPFLFLYRN